MAYLINRQHFIPFYVQNGGVPVTGLIRANFVATFFRDLAVCTLPVVLAEKGAGFYIASYTPDIPGFYYLDLYNAANTTRISNGIEIDSPETQFGTSNVIKLTQDYLTVGALKPQVSHPENYVLYIYTSINWNLGNTGPAFVIGLTELDTSGNWLTSPISVLPDTYHLVLKDTFGHIIVFRPYLNLTV